MMVKYSIIKFYKIVKIKSIKEACLVLKFVFFCETMGCELSDMIDQ